MNNSTISIIIPVYNVENYVGETLLSVKNQTSSPDEVIIINDGSTDNSYNIINKFADLKGFKILQTENQGLGLTRNYGISLSKSDYIYFLDADDVIENNFIYEMRKSINQYNKPDIILFSGKTFSNQNEIKKKINLQFTINGQFFRGDKLLTKMVEKKETLPQSSRYLTKKKLWTANNLSYPKGIAEDESLFFPLIALSNNTVIKTQSYYWYRVNRPGSITDELVKPTHIRRLLK
jgi:glycosyltransferase involved in cell wall biosynthesis